jgi:hypothetical protein
MPERGKNRIALKGAAMAGDHEVLVALVEEAEVDWQATLFGRLSINAILTFR